MSEGATGSVHLSLHTRISFIEDGLLGLVLVVPERKLANRAVVTERVERVRETHNACFTHTASTLRLRGRRAALRKRTVRCRWFW